MTAKTRERLQMRRRHATCRALGIQGWKVANEFLAGEVNSSPFEAKEANSKLKHTASSLLSLALCPLPADQKLDMIGLHKHGTKLCATTEPLNQGFGGDAVERVNGTNEREPSSDFAIENHNNISGTDKTAKKSTFQLYEAHKASKAAAVHLHDESDRPCQRALARPGNSRRKSHRP